MLEIHDTIPLKASAQKGHTVLLPTFYGSKLAKSHNQWHEMYAQPVAGGPAKPCGKVHGCILLSQTGGEKLDPQQLHSCQDSASSQNSLPQPQDCKIHHPRPPRLHHLRSGLTQDFHCLLIPNFLFLITSSVKPATDGCLGKSVQRAKRKSMSHRG